MSNHIQLRSYYVVDFLLIYKIKYPTWKTYWVKIIILYILFANEEIRNWHRGYVISILA